MAKVITTVRLEVELLQRIKRVSEARDESQTETIERMLALSIEDEEQVLGVLENPIVAAIVGRLAKTPMVLMAIQKAVGENMTEAEARELGERGTKQVNLAKQRRAQKQAKNQQPKLKGA